MSSDDIGAAFDKLDRLLEAAQEAGPSIALLLAAGEAQGITIARWALRLGPDTTADRDELTDVGALLIDWARR